MRLIFAGTPEFAAVALRALHAAGHDIALVLTQPDRPAGRGLQLQASPVKQFAENHGIAVTQPRSLRLDGKYPEDAHTAERLMRASASDVMVVAAYGLILPQWVLDLPRLGCINIHASLLPRWRGAAPIHRAIEAGDHKTGITLMQMDAGLDTGAMLTMQTLPIAPDDNTARLHDRLAALGGQMICAILPQLADGTVAAIAQPSTGVSYAHKIDKREAALDLRFSAPALAQKIRAFDPAPGCTLNLDGGLLKIWNAHAISTNTDAAVGSIVAVQPDGIQVATGDGLLALTELQKPGGKRLRCAQFLQTQSLKIGDRFAPPLPEQSLALPAHK